ncbi:OLC1v1011548C1 [Oldenlandia corymbosa var. corymbosa]|uniref:OLC1v1011548C1 n=1 Tax=Oldenlandia corymbosa var. corymbosa TaxID=529605 RepID=A0AAV1DU38_OLDCO|nr:OLC1v1011548C1 [Oldenlandia corymbosa var. corymbosa]
MEFITLLITFLLLGSMLVKILTQFNREKHPEVNLPPGPKPLPIIGNIHQLAGSPFLHRLLRDLAHKYGPLMHLKVGETPTIIVTSPEMAKEIYRTNDLLFSSRPPILQFKIFSYNFVGLIFSPYGNHWKQLRKLCTVELLSPSRVQTFRSIKEDEVFKLMESISSQEGSIVNLTKAVSILSYSITGRAALGKKNEQTQRYMDIVIEMNRLASEFSLADLYPSVKLFQVFNTKRYKLERGHKQIDEIIGNILNEHKQRIEEGKGEDAKENLVQVLINIQRRNDFEPELTDECIKAVIFDIFTAGSETSAILLEWAFAEIIRNPEVLKRAQDEARSVFSEVGNVDESRLHELKYLHAIYKESLRLHPSAPLLLPRICGEKCEINGYEIPKHATVIVNAWAIGRDPAHWTEAEKFDPDRFLNSEVDYKGTDFEYIPFGAGRRICPGISFAQPSNELILAQLLFHFDWQLPGGLKNEELDMNENLGLTVKRLNDLLLIPSLYQHSCLRKVH